MICKYNSVTKLYFTCEVFVFRLVCTDSLARGMDFTGVQCVISYAAPKYLKTYIHRAGRTARAGAFGLAVTMLHSTQVSHFMGLLKQAGKNNLSEVYFLCNIYVCFL